MYAFFSSLVCVTPATEVVVVFFAAGFEGEKNRSRSLVRGKRAMREKRRRREKRKRGEVMLCWNMGYRRLDT